MSGKRTFEDGPGQNLESICRAVKRLHTYSPDLDQDQHLGSNAAANIHQQSSAAQLSADAAAASQRDHISSQSEQRGDAALQQLRLPPNALNPAQALTSERHIAAASGQPASAANDVAGPSTPIRQGEGSSGCGNMTAEELRNYEWTNMLLKELHFERLRRLTIHE